MRLHVGAQIAFVLAWSIVAAAVIHLASRKPSRGLFAWVPKERAFPTVPFHPR